MKINTTEFIARAAGYNGVPLPIESIVTDAVSVKKGRVAEYEGEPCKCLMCGNSHTRGYMASKESLKSAAEMLIPKSANFGYELAESGGDFLCEYCGWLNLHYANSEKARDGGKRIQNVFIDRNGMEVMEFKSTVTNNALYDILRNPPEPPYFIIINSGGTVLENMAFVAKPTISRGGVVVTYGLANLVVQPKKVFEAIDHVAGIVERYNRSVPKTHKLTGGEDLFWNRQGEDGGYSVVRSPYFRSETFAKELSDFILKYSRSTRVVAKMVYLSHQKYLKDQKTKGE